MSITPSKLERYPSHTFCTCIRTNQEFLAASHTSGHAPQLLISRRRPVIHNETVVVDACSRQQRTTRGLCNYSAAVQYVQSLRCCVDLIERSVTMPVIAGKGSHPQGPVCVPAHRHLVPFPRLSLCTASSGREAQSALCRTRNKHAEQFRRALVDLYMVLPLSRLLKAVMRDREGRILAVGMDTK
ncbi:hypothetical protein BDN70DRAFT_898610 [Pholiota conissans]|uniref:Uncharacterized protein n=1 Tax=Pholiota conissans TaxID=109636 RepID=A0A9P6CVL3_9AGAR|nr:hypothetical protein BDN70DRAFT_898610 [Pholiota conissans]